MSARSMCLLLALSASLMACDDSPPSAPDDGDGTQVRYEGAAVIYYASGDGVITRRVTNAGGTPACDVRWRVSWRGQTKVADIGTLNPGELVEVTLRFPGVTGGSPSQSLSAEPC